MIWFYILVHSFPGMQKILPLSFFAYNRRTKGLHTGCIYMITRACFTFSVFFSSLDDLRMTRKIKQNS